MSNINELFVPYEESLELKELGFDEPCLSLFTRDKSFLIKEMPNQKECKTYFGGILRPTFSQAFRWFRDKYKLQSYIRHECSNVEYYYDFVINEDVYDVIKDTCEEAELACLRKLIDIVKKK